MQNKNKNMMLKNKFISKNLIVAAVLLFGFWAQSSQAVEYGMIGGKPANPDAGVENSESWFMYNLKPGEVKDDAVLVMNLFDETNDLVIYAADTTPSSSGGFALKQFAETKIEVGNWIKFYPEAVPEKFQSVFESKNKSISKLCLTNREDLQQDLGKTKLEDVDYEALNKWCQGASSVDIQLGPKEKKELPFVVKIPENAEIGEHTGGVLIQKKATEDKQVNQGSSVKLTTRVGVRIYETVPGEAIRKLSLSDFRIVKNFSEFSFVDWLGENKKSKEFLVESVIKNEGNVSISHANNLTVKNLLTGKEEIFDREFQVLRGDEFIANYSWPKPMLGYYSFVSKIAYETKVGQQVFSSQVIKKIVIPWRELTLVVVFIGLVFLGCWLWKRNYKKKYGGVGWVEYSVKKTDTIAKLAQKYLIDWEILVRTNKLKPPFLLEAGMILLVPPMETDKGEKVVAQITEPAKAMEKTVQEKKVSVKTKAASKKTPEAVLVAPTKKAFNLKYLLWIGAGLLFAIMLATIIMLATKNKDEKIATQLSITDLGSTEQQLKTTLIEKAPEKVAAEVVEKEKGDILILNGGAAPGTAGKLSVFLEGKGFAQIITKNAELDTHEGVVVYYQAEYETFAKKIMDVLSVKYENAKSQFAQDDEQKSSNVVILLGK
jgi:hypothetical protein